MTEKISMGVILWNFHTVFQKLSIFRETEEVHYFLHKLMFQNLLIFRAIEVKLVFRVNTVIDRLCIYNCLLDIVLEFIEIL